MKSAISTRESVISRRQPGSGSPTGRSSAGSSKFGALIEFARNLDLVQTVSLLTLVLTAVFGFDHWLFHIVARTCLLVFVLSPRSIHRPLFWLVLAFAGTITIILTWELVDNHKYLLDYWLWVLFVVHLFPQVDQRRRVILFSARFFLCLTFLAASAQKISSHSYRSGEMFEYYLYVDPRFAAFGKLIGIDPSVGEAVKKRTMFLRSPFAEVQGNEIQIAGSNRARVAGLAMTWWDLSLQLTTGALFLFGRRRTDAIAHVLLLFFIFTTYIPAPVFGFGWILTTTGLALAKDKFPKIAAAYLVSFFAILLYQLPWREWVLK
jgi:hypothetical protein